jgi:DedD protein
MDSAMRDLEQIREKDDSDGRPVALIGLLIGVTVVLVLGLGMVVGAWSEDEAEIAADDPLARLHEREGLAAQAEESDPIEEVEIDPSTLTFPDVLAPAEEERPEVAAALAAAAAELAHPEPIDPMPYVGPAAPLVPAALPASIAAGAESAEIARTAARDPLVRDALPEPPSARAAAMGRDGAYTIQVISYDSPEGAEAFATALRSRGHRAFVMSAPVEGRGTMYRVRIGPFETQAEAQTYRRTFEESERMNTLLVRRRAEEG